MLLAACHQPAALLPESLDLPAYCSTKVRLEPPPPHDGDRTIAQVIAWARHAARTANAAMTERDSCALNYAQMRAACSTAAGCIVRKTRHHEGCALMSDTLPATTVGHGPDPHEQRPLGPGEQSGREMVLIAEKPAMDEDELTAVWCGLWNEATEYSDKLNNARVRALGLYNGDALGDEEDGRSQIVMTEVKDTISAVMPTVVRVFCGAERPVEFAPQADGDEEEAQQATNYVQHVFFNECDGFRAIHDSALDAMQLKAGWIRWWWDTTVDVKTERYTGLLEQQTAALITQPGVKALKVARRSATEEEMYGLQGSPEGQLVQLRPGVPLLLYDVTLTRRSMRNRPCVAAVAAEQVRIDPDASGPHDARGVFIVKIIPISNLVARGHDAEELEQYAGETTDRTNNNVTQKRDELAAFVGRTPSGDASMRLITYTEGWVRIDYDGDGIAELRHIEAVGDMGQKIIANEGASHVQLARITPFFVPHKAIGESYADRIGDLQAISSRVMRNILDSMAESIHPRTVIVDGQVPIDDVLNTEMGAVIRERQPGAVRELSKAFIGPQAIPIVELLAAVKEQRTGITQASQGLTADSLQSTSAIGISAQLSAAQDRLELVMRCIAEGIKYAYAGVLDMMCEHQDRARMVRLRGKWTPVDPRAWMARFQVLVDPAVGRGTLAERLQILSAVAGKQESILQTLGPSNPLVTLGQYSNTLTDMLTAAGIRNEGRYFNDLPSNYAPPPPPPKPSPDELLAQVEVAKSNNTAASDQAATRQKQQQMLLDDDRARDEAKANALLQLADLMGKYPNLHLDPAVLMQLLDRDAEVTMALYQSAAGAPGAAPGALPPGAPGVPGGQPGPAGPMPMPPTGTAGPARPGQSLADARVFLPPQLISALASYNKAATAGPQFPSPRQVP